MALELESCLTPERLSRIESTLGKRQADLHVVMENIDDPHNAAAVLRSCDAVGALNVHIYNERKWNRRSARSSTDKGARRWLQIHRYETRADLIGYFTRHAIPLLVTRETPGAQSIYEADFTKPCAVCLGNEHDGVSAELNAAASGAIWIPMMGMVQSLNVSVAAAVILYEVLRQRLKAGRYDPPTLPPETAQELHDRWVHPKGGPPTPRP